MQKNLRNSMLTGALLLAVAAGLAPTATSAPTETPSAKAARLAWWREARFGMFIHYGPVTLTGKEISWSRANSNTNCPNHGPTPAEVYDNLYKQFNPTNFNAADWAGIARMAGMKYVVLTAKHGDGFLLWDSRVDAYNIMHSPFHRDLCGELADAVHRAGLHMGWYFSPMDWRDPDCRSANNDRFVAHMQDELRELLTNYGKIDVLWFDSDGRPVDWHPGTTYPLVCGLQPQIIINNRLEMATADQWRNQGSLRANEDFYTPEQRIGAYDDQRPWETCMTLGTQWSWKPNDKIKSAAEVVGILAQTVGGDGNLLLDVGPMPDGRIEPRQVEVLKKVGAWMAVNGESIYGTRGGPWKPTKQITSTRKGDVVYVFVLNRDQTEIELPALPRKIISASVLGGGVVSMETANEKIVLHLRPREAWTATVIKLQLDGSAMDIPATILPEPKPVEPTQTNHPRPRVSQQNVFNVLDYGAVGDDQTDNTAAFSKCMAALIAAGGGQMFLPLGVYRGQIVVPPVSSPFKSWITVEIVGEREPAPVFGTVGNFPLQNYGTIVKCLATNGGAVIAAARPAQPLYGVFSAVDVVIRNLDVRTYDNPAIGGIDLGYAMQCHLENVFIETGVYSVQASQPTHGTAGLVTPRTDNAALTILRNVAVSGYDTGIVAYEHTDGDNINLCGDINGLTFAPAYHASRFGRVGVQRCTHAVTVTGRHGFSIQELDIERAGPGQNSPMNAWQTSQDEINDPNNLGVGDLNYWVVIGGVGAQKVFTKNGGASIQARRLGSVSAVDAAQANVPPVSAARVKQLQDLRWGMFVCWSFSTFSGKEWTPGVTNLDLFAAKDCDTDQWAKTAKDAGMGYILFLTKHHDGFCLWDTQTTDRKVTRAPLGRDMLAELKKSCDKYGLKLALYFSEGEWAWPDFPDGRKRLHNGGYNPELKKAQLRELLTKYGPIEYIWFDHAVGDGGLSHAETARWVKQFQPDCFVGFNSGAQEGADIRLGEEGHPAPLSDKAGAGFNQTVMTGENNYRLAEFTYPILPKHEGGANWFYSLPKHEQLCLPAEKIYADYLGAVKFGNIFSLDVGPDYSGKLRAVDVATLHQVGEMIRSQRAATADNGAILEKNALPLTGVMSSTTDTNPQKPHHSGGVTNLSQGTNIHDDKLEQIFRSPPAEARPWVYWFWMGSTITSNGITGDLQALHDAGFGGSVMCSMSDICSPWPAPIANAPTPDIIAFNDKWWQLVRHAAQESHRLGLEFGIGNCAGCETCGGPWVTPEYSMQEVVWSETKFSGPGNFSGPLPKPDVDVHAHMPFPVYIGHTGKLAKPEVPARKTYFRDIAVLAVPAQGVIATNQIFDLSDKLTPDGKIAWDAPSGDWVIYRFGHTTMGSLIQPCQWEAIGLQADMMSREAMAFDLDHVIGDIQKHAGDLIGKGLNFVWFDSYEAGTPTWTPKMREEFQARRGYDLTEFLPVLAKRTVGSTNETKRFKGDFNRTVQDLYRDVYFSVILQKLHAAGLKFCNEPYWGPWKIPEVITNLDYVVAEFWVKNKSYDASAVPAVVSAARAHGINLISAEAFTAWPKDSQWDETPAELKSVGDAAFCDGINRFVLHRYVHQPYGDQYKPGIAMGQWGTQFDRTQTWWPQFKAMVEYWQRCDALLQWGQIATNDFAAATAEAGLSLKAIHRRDDSAEVYFVANLAHTNGAAKCAFGVVGKQPELWNPVTGETRDLPEFAMADGKTIVPLQFADSESRFVVFRRPVSLTETFASTSNFPELEAIDEISGAWSVQFYSKWGGPKRPVEFARLENWTNRTETGIKYYSGTAVYQKTFDLPGAKMDAKHSKLYLDLGEVRDVAEVSLNGHDLGVVWTAPWRVEVSGLVKTKHNRLTVKVTNCWANRQIGDEQLPTACKFGQGSFGYGGPLKSFPDWLVKNRTRTSGRLTFTTWNYFNKNSPLESSGLLGPVQLFREYVDNAN